MDGTGLPTFIAITHEKEKKKGDNLSASKYQMGKSWEMVTSVSQLDNILS